jgi:hypothetical protein
MLDNSNILLEQLKELCQERNISFYKKTKAELLHVLRNHRVDENVSENTQTSDVGLL